MGGPTRWPYGTALGFVNQFQFSVGPTVSGTAGLITSGDTTPDVSLGDLFIINNTSATVISYFDLQAYSYKAADYQGKKITLMVVDNGSTSFANAGQLFTQGSGLATVGNNPAFYTFAHFNSSWYELEGSQINRQESQALTIGSAGSINVDGSNLIIVTGTAATSIVRSFSGGFIGQTVILTAVGTSGVNHYVDNVGNLAMAGTAMYAINVSGSYQFTKVSATLWKMLHIGTTGIANV